jgi:hypothetical protein
MVETACLGFGAILQLDFLPFASAMYCTISLSYMELQNMAISWCSSTVAKNG